MSEPWIQVLSKNRFSHSHKSYRGALQNRYLNPKNQNPQHQIIAHVKLCMCLCYYDTSKYTNTCWLNSFSKYLLSRRSLQERNVHAVIEWIYRLKTINHRIRARPLGMVLEWATKHTNHTLYNVHTHLTEHDPYNFDQFLRFIYNIIWWWHYG